MKSKSLSHVSVKSTPSAVTCPFPSRVASRRCSKASLETLTRNLVLALSLSTSVALSGCYVPPSNKNANGASPTTVSTPTTASNGSTEANPASIATEATTITESLTLETPTPGWTLQTLFLYQVGDELWCLHQLNPPEGMVAQMLSTTSTEFEFVPPSDPVSPLKHFVVGKTWKWDANPEVTFLDSFTSIQPQIQDLSPIPLRQES